MLDAFKVGWKCQADLTKKSLASAYGVLNWSDKDLGNFWFRSNCLNRFVGLGYSRKCGANDAMAAELQYDFQSSKEGLFGKPLFLRYAHHHNWQNGLATTAQLNFGSTLWLTGKYAWKVNDNVGFTVTERFDLRNLNNWTKGIAFEMKL